MEEKELKRRLWMLEHVPQPMTKDRIVNAFTYRPRPGDIWLVQYPSGKRKKWVDSIRTRQVRMDDGSDRWKLYVDWQRNPKGRYSGAFVRALLRRGKLTHRLYSQKEIENAKSSLCKEST